MMLYFGSWAPLFFVHLSLVSAATTNTFSVYSEKLLLQPGQVHNAWVKPLALPDEIVALYMNKTLHLKGVQLDIVRINPTTGEEQSLPLTDVYNHHHALIIGDTEHLESFYNRSKGRGPFGNLRQHDHYGHSGCMMHGATINELLDHVNTMIDQSPSRSKVASFGGASGAEFRGTPTFVAEPYASLVESPQSFMPLLHFINMHGAPNLSLKRFECPCTSARQINVTNGTVDGRKPVAFGCSSELVSQHNPSCSLATYKGGYRCCEHGVFVSESIPSRDVPADELQAKFTFTYYENLANPRAVSKPDCCDASGNLTHKGNLEYDIPQCPTGTPSQMCVHVAESVQYFAMPSSYGGNHSSHDKVDPDEVWELIHAWGHQHVGALSMELYNEQTGQLLCQTKPQYGQGSTPGDEEGFLVGIPPCVWGPPPLPPPPQLRRGDLLRTVARYNSSTSHTGVMSLWLMDASPLPKKIPTNEVLV